MDVSPGEGRSFLSPFFYLSICGTTTKCILSVIQEPPFWQPVEKDSKGEFSFPGLRLINQFIGI